jgi:hypothetical protein
VQVGSDAPVGATILAQTAGLVLTSIAARLVPGMHDSARRATLHLFTVVAMAIWWFPRHWHNMELISVGYFAVFVAVQAIVALLVFVTGWFVRELRG